MKLAVNVVAESITAAVGALDGQALAEKTLTALRTLAGEGHPLPDQVSYEQIALAMLMAMSGLPVSTARDEIKALELHSVTANGPSLGTGMTMDVEEAVEHPLLFNWMDLSAEAGLARVLRAGGLRTLMTPGAPYIAGFSMQRSGDRIAAVLEEHFALADGGWLAAKMNFGEPIGGGPIVINGPAMIATTHLSGFALLHIGAQARSSSFHREAPPVDEQTVAPEIQPDVRVVH